MVFFIFCVQHAVFFLGEEVVVTHFSSLEQQVGIVPTSI